MPIISSVSLSIGRTVNIGNYESLRIEVSAEARVPVGTKPESVLNSLERSLISDLEKRIKTQVKALRG